MIDNNTYRAIFWEIFNALKTSKNNFVSTKTCISMVWTTTSMTNSLYKGDLDP